MTQNEFNFLQEALREKVDKLCMNLVEADTKIKKLNEESAEPKETKKEKKE